MKTAEIIKNLMKQNNISKQTDLARIIFNKDKIDLNERVKVNSYLNGLNKFPNDVLVTLSKYFNVSLDYLYGIEEERKPVKSVPIIGTASCGASDINHLQAEDLKAYIMADDWNKDLYSVIACGDSMFPHIKDGAKLIIDPTIKPQHGDTVLYSLDDEYAVKIFTVNKEAHIIEFIPLNPSEHFKTRTIRLENEDVISRLKVHLVKDIINPVEYNKSAILKLIGK